jgi:hypothetical protein
MFNLNFLISCGLLFLSLASCTKDATNTNLKPNQVGTSAPMVDALFAIDSLGKDVQFFTETYTVASQKERLKLRKNPSQMLPTGFVTKANSSLTLHVELVEGSRVPVVMIGTYERGKDRHKVQQTPLAVGDNTIHTEEGGIIWIVYVNKEPHSKAKVTFIKGHHPLPVFIKNKTSQQEWQKQLTAFNTNNEVLMIGQRVYMVYDKDLHPNVGTQDNNEILGAADFTFDVEDDFSGLDGSSPQHERLPIRHLMVQNAKGTSPGGMSATDFRTVYPTKVAKENVFVENGIAKSWGVWHEFGHMHEQLPYFFKGLSDVTTNLYSLAAERARGKKPDRLRNIWPKALRFLADTNPGKSFASQDYWTKLLMFHQLWLAYGDDFYKQLHKLTREDRGIYETDDSKLKNFAIKACKISGHNLTTFFKKWGLRDAAGMYSAIDALRLPVPTVDPSTLTDD